MRRSRKVDLRRMYPLTLAHRGTKAESLLQDSMWIRPRRALAAWSRASHGELRALASGFPDQ